MTRLCHKQLGRAGPLCPGNSDIYLFRYCKRVIDFDPEIANRAFNLCMPKQQLDGSEIPCSPIDEACFGAAQGMRPETCLHQAPRSRSTYPLAGRIAGCLSFARDFDGSERG